MKISEYIQYLQKLQNNHGDVDVKVNITYECSDLSINDTFNDPEKPEYNKHQKCIVIYREFSFYR